MEIKQKILQFNSSLLVDAPSDIVANQDVLICGMLKCLIRLSLVSDDSKGGCTSAGTRLDLHVNETTITFPFAEAQAKDVSTAINNLLQTFAAKQAAERPKRWQSMEYRYKGAQSQKVSSTAFVGPPSGLPSMEDEQKPPFASQATCLWMDGPHRQGLRAMHAVISSDLGSTLLPYRHSLLQQS